MARLGLDSTDFKLGVKQAESAFGAFSKRVGGEFASIGASLAGMFTVGAAVNWVKSVSDAVGEIKDMAELLEISTDEVQRLQKAAAGSGQSFEVVAMAMQRIQQLRAQAQAGDKGPSGLFAILGIDPSKGSAADIIKQALEASSRGVGENAAAFELLGKKAASLRMVLGELESQGPVKIISEEQLDQIDAVSKRLENALREMKVASAPAVSKTLETGATMFNMFNPNLNEQIREIGRRGTAGEFGLMKEAELKAMAMMGISDDEGRRFEPLDLNAALSRRGSRTSAVDVGSALMRSAIANEAIHELLKERTR